MVQMVEMYEVFIPLLSTIVNWANRGFHDGATRWFKGNKAVILGPLSNFTKMTAVTN